MSMPPVQADSTPSDAPSDAPSDTPPALRRLRIGLLGGSFDPIHVGHLALGQSALLALPLDQVHILPTARSWQKAGAQTASTHRLAMCRLAAQATRDPRWRVDDTEVRRGGPTYTVETLHELRARLGPDVALVLLMGGDQLRNLPTWHRWQELLTLAHIAVTGREQSLDTPLPPAIEALLAERGAQALPDRPSGSVVFFRMPAVAVSASGLRAQLRAGATAAGLAPLLPSGIPDYIAQHGLYRPDASAPA